MSFNGSGTFVINSAGQPVVSGTVISSTAFNALTADLANGLSTCITKDGQTTPTADIPMGSNKITGLANGTAAGDAANLGQVQSTVAKLLGSVSGADTITAVGSPTVAAYAAGQMFYFVAAGANTGAVTINIDSLGAKSITRDGTTALAAGDIQSGEVCVIVYDGTQFQLVNGASQSASIVTENLTVNKATVLNESGGDNDTRIEGDSDANLFFVDASADSVGIGTSSPATKLDVTGTVTADGLTVDGAAVITKTGTNASPHIKLTESGDTREFNIFNDGSGNGRLVLADTDDTPDTEIVLADNGILQFKTADTERLNIAANGDISFYEDTGTSAKFFWDASAESLGIGTSSPGVSADSGFGFVPGSTSVLYTTGSNGNGALLLGNNNGGSNSSNGTNCGYIAFRARHNGAFGGSSDVASIFGTYTGDGTTRSGAIRFLTLNAGAEAERARIDSSGNLLVGTTSGSFNRIVKSNNNNYALQIVNTSATTPYCAEFNLSGVTGGAGAAFLVCYDNANRLVIRGDGDVENVNNSYGAISDEKVKQDIVDASSQWNDIKGLRVRKFRYKADPTAPLQIGLVAQEAEVVSPGLVNEHPDHEEVEVTDEEGNVTKERQPTGTTTKSVKYSVLYMKAIKALQEAMTRIEDLEAKVAALEAK